MVDVGRIVKHASYVTAHLTGRADPDTQTWWHVPPGTPAGRHRIRACAPDGSDFARLVWQACRKCRPGLIVKTRVTGPWQRHGYGSRMMRSALRGRDGYACTTTPQPQGRPGVLPGRDRLDGRGLHPAGPPMRAHASPGPRRIEPSQRFDSPPS